MLSPAETPSSSAVFSLRTTLPSMKGSSLPVGLRRVKYSVTFWGPSAATRVTLRSLVLSRLS